MSIEHAPRITASDGGCEWGVVLELASHITLLDRSVGWNKCVAIKETLCRQGQSYLMGVSETMGATDGLRLSRVRYTCESALTSA